MRRSGMDPLMERTRGDMIRKRLIEDDVRRELRTITMEGKERRGVGGFQPPAGISPAPSIFVGNERSSKIGEPRNLLGNEVARMVGTGGFQQPAGILPAPSIFVGNEESSKIGEPRNLLGNEVARIVGTGGFQPHAPISAPPIFAGNEGSSMFGEPRNFVGNDVARMVGESHRLTSNEGVRMAGEPRLFGGANVMMGEPHVLTGSNDGARRESGPHILPGNEHAGMIGQRSIFPSLEGIRMASETHAFVGNEGARMIEEPHNYPINEGVRMIGGPTIFPGTEGAAMFGVPRIFPGNGGADLTGVAHIGVSHIGVPHIGVPHIGVPHVFPGNVGGMLAGEPHTFAGNEDIMRMSHVQQSVFQIPNAVNVSAPRMAPMQHNVLQSPNAIDVGKRSFGELRPSRCNVVVVDDVERKPRKPHFARSIDDKSSVITVVGTKRNSGPAAKIDSLPQPSNEGGSSDLCKISTSSPFSSKKNVEKPVRVLPEKRLNVGRTSEQRTEGPAKAKVKCEKPVQNVKKSVELPEKNKMEHKIEDPSKTKLRCEKPAEELSEKGLNAKHTSDKKTEGPAKVKVECEKPSQKAVKSPEEKANAKHTTGKQVEGKVNSMFLCEICKIDCRSSGSLEFHLKGKKHKTMLKRLNLQAANNDGEKNDTTGMEVGKGVNQNAGAKQLQDSSHVLGSSTQSAKIDSRIIENGKGAKQDGGATNLVKKDAGGKQVEGMEKVVPMDADGIASIASASSKLHTDEKPPKKKLVANAAKVNAIDPQDEVALSMKAKKPVQDLPKDKTEQHAKKRKRDILRCELCNVDCFGIISFQDHLKGKKHRTRKQETVKQHKKQRG